MHQRPLLDDLAELHGTGAGGQQPVAAYLLERGANLDWISTNDHTSLDAAMRSDANELVGWLRARRAKTADEARGAT